MANFRCSDYTIRILESTGLINRVQEEIFDNPELNPYFFGDSRNIGKIRDIGANAAGFLGLKIDSSYRFRNMDELYAGLGAYIADEFPRSCFYSWRRDGRKNIVFNGDGEGAFVNQSSTESLRPIIYPVKERTMFLDWSSWPLVFGLALVHAFRNNSGTNLQQYSEDFLEKYNGSIPGSLFAESHTDNELFGTPAGPREHLEGENRLDRMMSRRLRDVFRSKLSDKPVIFSGRDGRNYFGYISDRDLVFDIPAESMMYSEDRTPLRRLNKVQFGANYPIRDWISFSPAESLELLRACLVNYTRERREIPEILCMFDVEMADRD